MVRTRNQQWLCSGVHEDSHRPGPAWAARELSTGLEAHVVVVEGGVGTDGSFLMH